MGRWFLRVNDDASLSYPFNFSTLLTANSAAYHIDQSVAASYAGKYGTYKIMLAAAKAPKTRGNATMLAKNTVGRT